MKKKNNKSKIMSFLLVLFLCVSIFSAIKVTANFVTLEEDGLIYDEFNNSVDIDVMVNCSNQGGRINLTRGNPIYEYNYEKEPDNLDVWYHEKIFLPENFLGKIIAQYVSPKLLFGNSVTHSSDLAKIATIDDGKELNTTGKKFSSTNPTPANPIQHYRFTIDQEKDLIDNVTIQWWHGPFQSDSNLKNINMYIWSNGSIIPLWENVSEVIYDSTNIDKIDNSSDLKYTFSDVDYIDEDGCIDILIIGTPDHDGDQTMLFTDFINLSVSTIEGYSSEGYVISEPIEPSDFGGWEKAFWESSEYSKGSGVTLYILDEDKDFIEGFSSTTMSFDISDIDEDSIRLKAVLHSTSPDITPMLYSWGVMWQKEDGYVDTFDSSYRIEETVGTIIDSGKIGVSSYYSDWEFFGKYPDNTRGYDGKTINSEPDSWYWYTENGFGGGFRSPVVSEGKVYVASSKDKKIYAFNETADSEITTQKPVDESDILPFEVDSCIAVTEDCVIVGTAAYGKNNKLATITAAQLKAHATKEIRKKAAKVSGDGAVSDIQVNTEDIGGTQAMAFDCDNSMGVVLDEEDPHTKMFVSITKARDNEAHKTITLDFDGRLGRVSDPELAPGQIDQVSDLVYNNNVSSAQLIKRLESEDDLFNGMDEDSGEDWDIDEAVDKSNETQKETTMTTTELVFDDSSDDSSLLDEGTNSDNFDLDDIDIG